MAALRGRPDPLALSAELRSRSPHMTQFIERCVALGEAERYQSAREAARSLQLSAGASSSRHRTAPPTAPVCGATEERITAEAERYQTSGDAARPLQSNKGESQNRQRVAGHGANTQATSAGMGLRITHPAFACAAWATGLAASLFAVDTLFLESLLASRVFHFHTIGEAYSALGVIVLGSAMVWIALILVIARVRHPHLSLLSLVLRAIGLQFVSAALVVFALFVCIVFQWDPHQRLEQTLNIEYEVAMLQVCAISLPLVSVFAWNPRRREDWLFAATSAGLILLDFVVFVLDGHGFITEYPTLVAICVIEYLRLNEQARIAASGLMNASTQTPALRLVFGLALMILALILWINAFVPHNSAWNWRGGGW